MGLAQDYRYRIAESGFPEFTRFFILTFPSGAATSA
jgi:hypothetical protein